MESNGNHYPLSVLATNIPPFLSLPPSRLKLIRHPFQELIVAEKSTGASGRWIIFALGMFGLRVKPGLTAWSPRHYSKSSYTLFFCRLISIASSIAVMGGFFAGLRGNVGHGCSFCSVFFVFIAILGVRAGEDGG